MTAKIDGTKGTSSPGLYANGTFSDTYTDGVVVDYTTGLGRISTGTSDGLAIYNGGVAATEQMRIDSSGNLLIGTTSALGDLTITRSDAAELVLQATGSGGNAWFVQTGNTGSTINGALRFYDYNAGAERMRIDNNGNLLIATTSAIVSGVPFQLLGPAGASAGVIKVQTDGNGAFVFRNTANTTVGSISVNASTTTYATSSDYRLKENIQPMQNALGVVEQLNPVTYTWKTSGESGQGFIAHELQAVVPDCVTGEKDAVDAEGKPVYQGIDTSFLVATLAKAIQELNAKVTQLEEVVVNQQSEINDLKAKVV